MAVGFALEGIIHVSTLASQEGNQRGNEISRQKQRPPAFALADVDALVQCLSALGDYAWADRSHIAEIDVNPIVVLPRGRGCVVVDALVVPRTA